MNFCCENCGWSEIVGSPIMCNYSGHRTWRDECCEAWKPKENQPTVSGWISVKDRFPEFPCITYDIHGNMDYCKTGIVKMCIDGTWYACTENMVHLEEVLHPNKNTAAMVMGNHITHWMPLPEPPKED